MNRNTIKWRIFKYNIIVIIMLIILTTVVFNIAVRMYIENDVLKQLDTIALTAEDTALHMGPDFFPHIGGGPADNKNPDDHNPPPPKMQDKYSQNKNDLLGFYFMLDRSLRKPLSLLNADYILLDSKNEPVTSPDGDYFKPSDEIVENVTDKIKSIKDTGVQQYINFSIDGIEYIAILRPVSGKNSFGLGWIIVYSSLKKLNQLKFGINIMLFIVLILSAVVTAIFSSISAKKISSPFTSLNRHIGEIAKRNFATKLNIQLDDELQDFVNNINTMSEKLETFDKAQKTFLQNASHEFRTPLMSIQSYAEGIKFDIVGHETASNIIIDETKRMTRLVEDLLYLSRLDAIEENYHFSVLDFNDFLSGCITRLNGIALKSKIKVIYAPTDKSLKIFADEEKLSRAVTNIVSNSIRYAGTVVKISSEISSESMLEISVLDDGPGIDANVLPHIFERFYKGRKGNSGLGLAISNNIIEKHNGNITGENTGSGALFRINLPYTV